MLTSLKWSLTVHSVSVSLRSLLLERSNVESLLTGAVERARASDSVSENESLSLSFAMVFVPSSLDLSRTSTKSSVCCGCLGLLSLDSLLRFCFFLGGWGSSSESLDISATSDVCTPFWLVTCPVGRRAALRAAKALTAESAVRKRSVFLGRCQLYLPLVDKETSAESQVHFLTHHFHSQGLLTGVPRFPSPRRLP